MSEHVLDTFSMSLPDKMSSSLTVADRSIFTPVVVVGGWVGVHQECECDGVVHICTQQQHVM